MKLPDFVSLATKTHVVSWWHQQPGWTLHSLSVWALKCLVTHGEKCILIYAFGNSCGSVVCIPQIHTELGRCQKQCHHNP